MALFPEMMNKIDPKDTKGSIETMERYIRYMVERMEFAQTNEVKRLGTADATTQDVVKMFLTTTDNINLMAAQVQQLTNQTIALSRQAGEINTKLAALTKRVDALDGGVTEEEETEG